MIKKYYKFVIFILLLLISVPLFYRIKYEVKYKKISYFVDYYTLIYNYNHFYYKESFEDYLKLLHRNKIFSCIVPVLRITDLLNLYNSAVLLRGSDFSLKNKINISVNENYLYLILPREINIKFLPYVKKIEYGFKNVYVFNMNFSQLNSYYINFPVKYEESIKKYLNLFYLKNPPSFGKIDSYINYNNDDKIVILNKTDYEKRFNKVHYYRKRGGKIFIDENFRAVLERNVKFLYIKDVKDKNNNIIDFIPLIRKMNKKLNLVGYEIKRAFFFNPLKPSIFFYLNKFGLYLIFIFIFSYILHSIYTSSNYFFFIFNIIIFSLFLSVITFNKLTYINAGFIPFIKISLFIPFISFWFSLSFFEKNKILNITLKLKYIFIISGVFILFLILIVRSGNYNMFTTGIEQKIRNLLENIFIIRPRFKEIFGYFFLYLVFFGKNDIIKKNLLILYFISIIGITTTFNSYLHTHTPILITTIRTVYGMAIGSLIGYLFNLIMKKIYE